MVNKFPLKEVQKLVLSNIRLSTIVNIPFKIDGFFRRFINKICFSFKKRNVSQLLRLSAR